MRKILETTERLEIVPVAAIGPPEGRGFAPQEPSDPGVLEKASHEALVSKDLDPTG
jgi:hypothetical protein